MERRKEWTHSKCPRCQADDEDAEHVWRCSDSRAVAQWQESMDKLTGWMKDNKTHPGIRIAMVEQLTAWRNGITIPATQAQQFFGVAEAQANQAEIGWKVLLEGCPAIGWEEAQQQYYNWLESRRTGKRWVAALIRKLWDVAWDMWDHRNGILHNKMEGQAAKERARRIIDEFEIGADGLDRDTRLLFHAGLQGVLRMQPAAQRQWIRRISIARDRAEEQGEEQAMEMEQG